MECGVWCHPVEPRSNQITTRHRRDTNARHGKFASLTLELDPPYKCGMFSNRQDKLFFLAEISVAKTKKTEKIENFQRRISRIRYSAGLAPQTARDTTGFDFG